MRAARGVERLPEAVQHLVDQGFTVIPKVSHRWYVSIVEKYYDLVTRHQTDVFSVWDAEAPSNDGEGVTLDDSHRKLTDIRTDRLLFSLIVGPATEAMSSLGFLDIYGEPKDGVRVSRDGSYLRSLMYRLQSHIQLQGFHTDGDCREADNHGPQFALYTITAGSQPAEVHLYPGHMGGVPDKYGVAVRPPCRVFLQPGDMLVMTGGTRHR